MKKKSTLTLVIFLNALFVVGCKKESVKPIMKETAPVAFVSGNTGWKIKIPTKNPQITGNMASKANNKQRASLESNKIYDTMNRAIIEGRAFIKQNGQRVYLERLHSGKYHGVKMNKDGSFPETMKNWSSDKIAEMAQSEKWPTYIIDELNNNKYR